MMEHFMAKHVIDEAKGRAKESAGALMDRQDLKREGKIDRAKGSLKNAVDRMGDAAKKASGSHK